MGWARRELVPEAPFCLVTQRSFPWREDTKIAVMESDWLAMLFKGDMLWMQNISLPLQGNTHSLLGYHEYHQIAVHFVKILNSLKQTSWYNLSSEKNILEIFN